MESSSTLPGQRKRALLGVTALLLVAAVLAGAYWWLWGRLHVGTDNAYVAGNLVQVSSQQAGTVVAILADDTDLVEAGALLVQLDDADAKVQLQAAEAGLADAVRAVRGLYAGDSQARAGVAARNADVQRSQHELERAQAELKRASDELARRESLFRQDFISGEALQAARTAVDASRASRDAASSALEQARSAVAQARSQQAGAEGLVDRTTLETHPRVQAAAARLRDAHLALARTRILAPVRGHVAKRSVQVGARIAAGAPLLSVVADEQLWVEANFKESELGAMRIGQPVRLQSDLYGSSVEYRGRIAGIASGTGSVFSVLPAQNASGNWIKVVQRLPVRVALESDNLKEHPLRLGLSMHATVDTSRSEGEILAGMPRQGAAFQTGVYASQATEADALIERVIRANR
jgi:membrane fusion protein (multidrug efflux system)